MSQTFSKGVLAAFLAISLIQFGGCGLGGEDKPFVFGDGSDGGNGSESPTPTGSGTSGNTTGSTAGGTSGDTTGGTTGGTTTPCEESGCPSGQVCDSTTHQCGLPSGACEVDFNASLALKIDAVKSTSGGHFDSPPACCEYTDVDGGSTCPTVPAGDLDHFLQAPSENTDLYCCSADSGAEVSGHPELFCDSENRHGGLPELAVTRWPAAAGAKIKMKFLVSDGGASCVASLVRDDFPEFKLENTALDAALVINAGEDYRTLPPNPSVDLNPAEITSPCTITTDGSGNVQVAIDSLPLHFLAKIYNNYTQCISGSTNPGPVVPGDCPSGPFASFFFESGPGVPDANTIQVIPGTSQTPLTLTTGSRTQAVIDAAKQNGAMNITGDQMHFDTGDNKTHMTLVAAFGFPDDAVTGVSRDDAAGSGQLLAELGKAMLTAEIKGTVTKAGTDSPIQTLADLTTNCGGGGTTAGGTTAGGTTAGGTTAGTTGGEPTCTEDDQCAVGKVCNTVTSHCETPTAALKLEEINTAAPNASVAQVLPATTPATVDFGESLLGIQTKTKLYRISNVGTKDIIINGVQAADVKMNFRVGSVYQGATFAARTWKIGQNPWTLPRGGSGDFFFFLSYGPFGKVGGTGSTRSDVGSLVINTDAGAFNVGLAGTAKRDSRATVALYVEDANRFSVTGATDPDLKDVDDGGTTRHLYLAKGKLFSFRQDNTPRTVFVFNNGTAGGIDNLEIQHLHFTADAGGKLVFTPDAAAEVTACFAAADSATTACKTLAAGGKLKLGTITFNAAPAGSYSVSEGGLDVKAVSKPAGGGEGVPPIIGGMPTNSNDNPLVPYALKGANGAPNGTFDLRVHRLIAGFANKINQGLQKTLIVSGSTKGILKRFNDGSSSDVNADNLKEVFTINDGMQLNPVTGAATLKRIVTAVDADMNNPANPSAITGLRLYDAPGSTPGNTEYFAECKTSPTHNCSFFYLYIGDWAGSIASTSCNGGTKFPVIQSYSGTQAARDALFATVMKPDNATEFSCLSGADGMKDETGGIFDPVTGEITFRDLAVRLYAPNVPALSNADVDATIRLSLTTQCVSPDLVPDTAAKGQFAVPANTMNDSSFNTALMATNPLLGYVDTPGTTCGTVRELHGRGMFQPDTTGTLDNDSDSDDLNFEGFDLAGVGRNVTSQTSVSPANMYIIIKAEVGNF
ncbi:MAG TPA: hypothetical protein VFX30_00015 [bacterium]|nr:hypothetical protein [bacterium]